MQMVIGQNNNMQPDFNTLKLSNTITPSNTTIGQPDFSSLKPVTDTSKVGSIPIISPIINTLSNIGTGIGTAVGKAGIGLGQSFLKLSNLVGNTLGTGTNQYDSNIQALETIKNKLYEEPFKEQLSTVSGKTGEFIGTALPFVATGGATTASQQFLKGASSNFVKGLAEGNGLQKVAGYFIKTGTNVLPDVANTYATQYVASGGDKESAKDVGIATAVLSGLTHVGSDVFNKIVPQTAKQAIEKTLSFTGKTKLANVINDKQVNDSVGAFTTLNNLAPEIKVLDSNGIEKVFDPTKATITEMPQALFQAKNKIYDAYSTLAEQSGEKGAFFGQADFNKLVNTLDKYSGKGYTQAFSNKANDIIQALYRYGKVNPKDGGIYFPNVKPSEMQNLIENINKDVNPLSDKAGSLVAQDASQTLRGILDRKIELATGGRYQELRNAYAQLKTIEQPIVNMYKKELARAKGSFGQDVINGISTVDGIMGLLTQNPSQLIRAGIIPAISKLFQYNRNPEVNMQRAFKLLRESATGKPVDSSMSARFLNTPEGTNAFKAGKQEADKFKNTPNKSGGFISTGKTDSLIQEAKKYKSAEEFVKKQPTVYHGTSLENSNKINAEGFKAGSGKGVSGQASNDFVYATENKVSAGKYVSDRLGIKNPTTVSGSFNGKVLDIQGKMADFEAFGEASKKLSVPLGVDSQGKLSMLDMPAIKKAMQEQGYGAIRFSDRYANGSKALAILPDQIKTKSQLTDIWNKANKPTIQ